MIGVKFERYPEVIIFELLYGRLLPAMISRPDWRCLKFSVADGQQGVRIVINYGVVDRNIKVAITETAAISVVAFRNIDLACSLTNLFLQEVQRTHLV